MVAQWADGPLDDAGREALGALVVALVERGGAVGWLEVPHGRERTAWADALLHGGGRLLLVSEGDRVVACGSWQRRSAPVLRGNAEIGKVMVAPQARGRGLARLVVERLVADADADGVELLTLGARGNNHAALGLYLSLGFVVTGRRPDSIAVGRERFDEVLLHLDLRARRAPTLPALVRHGSRREGPGAT